ncbi:hypothetical protein [Nocardia sp. NBC_01388]|uniref:hypothetical protein n=1 Tax=Nocardia sp. NBC_01388 TaxID=2903596 RepID=UPI0032539BEC
MITRLVILLTAPSWLLVTVAAAAGLGTILAVLVIFSGGIDSATSADLHYQCDSAIGPDPAATEAETATTAGEPETLLPSEAPTANPYAELTIAPGETGVSDWQRTCLSALRSAPYQLPALRTVNTGFAAECARQIALALVSGTGQAADGTADPEGMTAAVISRASAASTTATCESTAVMGNDPSVSRAGAVVPSASVSAAGCPSNGGTAPVVLPKSVAAQVVCGQRVDPVGVSAGDLVFWGYRDYAPTQVGIAVSATQVVVVDATNGRISQQALPAGPDVRVKRVLGGAS